jgi:isopenicillin N synthase-like dioxygenase
MRGLLSRADIPAIDIGPWFDGDPAARDAVARAVGDACEEWGFLVVSGHRIEADLMQAIAQISRDFFDLPVAEKLLCNAIGSAGGRGYYRMEAKSLARTLGDATAPGDLRESFRTGVEAVADDPYTTAPGAFGHFAPNIWPRRPAQFQEIWQRYFEACSSLTVDLMQICARALDLPENWFDDKIDRSTSNIVAQNYPKLDRPPVPGQLRNGAHTDFGTLTLLMAEDKPGGLQVMATDGSWHDLKPSSGTFIVNLGDMMAQWTNDRWRSTLHRVVNPPLDAGEAARRLSLVFFHTPNYDAVIECIPSCTDSARPPKYAPIRSGEHIAQKLKKVESVAREAV